ncbi:Signal peptide peptidase-like 2A, partial [Anabarilius grahami]
YPLVNLTSSQLCDVSHVIPGSVKGKAVVVMRGGCEFSQKALVAQSLNASVLLIASNRDLVTPAANDSEYSKVFPQGMEVRLYAPPVPSFDASIIVMLLIAVFTVTMGGFWSGAAEKVLTLRLRVSRARQAAGPSSEAGDGRSDSGELSLYSPLKVLLFVAMMCVMLVLMYFFYKWLVYVIIVIFCLASASALYNCLDSLMTAVGCGTLRINAANFIRHETNEVFYCASALMFRWIWILQDLLGIAFCLNFLKTISLSNFKICVILLSLLLLYDVFFVFITPFLTPGDGKGVVVPADPSSSYEKMEPLDTPEKLGTAEGSVTDPCSH